MRIVLITLTGEMLGIHREAFQTGLWFTWGVRRIRFACIRIAIRYVKSSMQENVTDDL